MEDLLMGDIPSDDSDAEDNNSKGLATQVTASTTSTANNKNQPPVVSGSTTTSSTTQAGSNSKSELTNRLKSLYKSPPGAAAQQASATSKVNVPSQQAVTAVKQQQNLPVSTPIQPNMRRGSSIPTTSVNTAVVSRGPSQNNSNPPPQKHVPPMIHQNHQPGQPNPGVVQQQQPVRPGGVPPAVVGRVPAPLPAARTANRSAPPSNRPAASVPVPTSSRTSSAPLVAMSAGVPPSPVITSSQQQQQRGQYAHHLRGSSAPSSSQQAAQQKHAQQKHAQQKQQMQAQQAQMRQQSSQSSSRSSSNSSRGLDDSGNSRGLSDQEKKEKERFLMFTRVLMKYLEQRDTSMHVKAKAQIKECYEKNKTGDPQFRSLTSSMKNRLRQTVGETYWKKAHDYLDHFLKQKMQSKEDKQQRSSSGGSDQHPSSSSHRAQSSGNRQPQMPPSQQQQQQHMMRMQAQSNNMPPAVGNNITLPDGRILTTEQKEAMDKKKAEDEEAEKKRKRNAQARKKRAEQKKLKEKDKKSNKTAVVSTGGGIAHTVTSVHSPSSANSGTPSSIGNVSKASTKAKKTVKRSSSSSSVTKRKTSAREPPHRYMETIDHATLIDVKNFPSLFNSKDYKNEGGVNLEEEQRILLYGDVKQQAKVKNITDAASKALDTALDVETMESKFREVGVKPLPTRIPSVYDGWGEKNVVSVRNAWAKIRLPESDMQREESAMGSETTKPLIADPALSSTAAPVPSSVASVPVPSIQNDTTNHVWFNEARAEQDPTLALISEATELFLKSTIENAIGKARLRQNLDGVRLWNTIQAHSAITDLDHDASPPPAYIRLGCDVRRQIALSEGNAAKVYQRMEEAITRQNDTYHPNDSSTDPHEMLLQSTSMADLSRKPPLKMAAQVADADAKRKFAVFVGSESMDPALGRVPRQATVTLQDLEVGDAGNRASMIGARRKRFRVGLKY